MTKILIEEATVKQVLEALEAMQSYAAAERKGLRICDEAITALREALAEQPAQRKPLTDEMLADCVPDEALIVERGGERTRVSMTRQQLHEFANRAVEAAHGIKEQP